MNDILTRLQNGESIDDIAAEFTKALNEASATYEAEIKAKKEAEAARVKKEQDNALKIDIFHDIADAFVEYIETFHPNFTFDGKTIAEIELDDEDYLEMSEMIDSFIELAASPLFTMMASPALKKKEKPTIEKVPNGVKITGKGPISETDLDKIFGEFFKTHKI